MIGRFERHLTSKKIQPNSLGVHDTWPILEASLFSIQTLRYSCVPDNLDRKQGSYCRRRAHGGAGALGPMGPPPVGAGAVGAVGAILPVAAAGVGTSCFLFLLLSPFV